MSDQKAKLPFYNLKRVIDSVKANGLAQTTAKIRKNLTRNSGKATEQMGMEAFSTYYKEISLELYQTASCKSDQYVELIQQDIERTPDDIKYIAFYLPQFHPIKENDEWWGRGFTEWTNVSKAVPQFKGHYQPHLPGELGFYDLRLVEVMKRQAELARNYGIFGFCFHHYWFGGKRLLERPLNQFFANTDIDFPFCICWANESWSRRWDGLENEVLMKQLHTPEDDIRFIEHLIPYFNDKRYIRIGSKPLLIIYRPGLFPNPQETAERWRTYCRQKGIGEIYLAAVQAFGFSDHREIGFDASIEFPPHTHTNDFYCNSLLDSTVILNPAFNGRIYDFASIVANKRYLREVTYKLFNTVSPGWDNTARKPNAGLIYHGANPDIYKEWLTDVSRLTKETKNKDEQIVFINAWNEWAEGAHLEPDRKFGYGYLQATAEALLEYRNNAR